jgi:hypothetical protein
MATIVKCNDSGRDMTSKTESSFAIVMFNEHTYLPGKVVAVVKRMTAAQKILAECILCQTPENRREGWRYFLEKSDLEPGMDPTKATQVRQVRSDVRDP